jgi:hypothetical protein
MAWADPAEAILRKVRQLRPILVSYSGDGRPVELEGYFGGIYPRFDRRHGRQRQVPLLSVLEARL